ncbi:hypothetical protein Y10_25210 [Neptunitalea sp. Y10]|uniref:Tetratricopeptide repeat-containing protein n=2 Tax=Neptunitalea lumnitzerae TaxID=2965509 RepID=A0ABQ5ML62_9FLAO|nr:hypothetical protein Y10_25210 [Neptunitalea sp. Y10]
MGVVLMTGMLSFGQKDEIKNAEKALKKEAYTEALDAVSSVDGATADDKYKGKYYYIVAKSNLELGTKDGFDVPTINKGLEAVDKLIAFEEQEGKSKYTDELKQLRADKAQTAATAAYEKYKAENYASASQDYEMVFKLSPVDTTMMYYAAVSAGLAKEYDRTTALYEGLLDMGYEGVDVTYVAIEKETGEEKSWGDAATRDLMVKSGDYINPEDKKSVSKRSEIVKNLGVLYIQLGENDKAIKAFETAREADPNDINLIINEATIYYQMEDYSKFKELMAEASAMAPDNADIQYNIGVANGQMKDYEGARAAYKKALEIKPDYKNAVLNLSGSYIDEANGLIEELNKLGNTQEEIKKYNALVEKREGIYKKSAEVLEEYLKASGTNDSDILEQLKQIYGAIGDSENYARVKGLLGE